MRRSLRSGLGGAMMQRFSSDYFFTGVFSLMLVLAVSSLAAAIAIP